MNLAINETVGMIFFQRIILNGKTVFICFSLIDFICKKTNVFAKFIVHLLSNCNNYQWFFRFASTFVNKRHLIHKILYIF